MKKTLTSKDVSCTVVSLPSAEELAEVVRESGLSPVDAEFMAQERQRPEVAARSQYILLLVQIPVFQKQERLTHGVGVYMVIREKEVWLLHFEPLDILQDLTGELESNSEKQEEYFQGGSLGLALYFVRRLYGSAFRKIERLSKHIEIAEDAVFHGNERKMVEEIAFLTRDVMDFRRVIRPQRRLFAEPLEHSLATPEIQEQWRRLSAQIAKIWDMLESLAEAVKQLGKTNFALLQHKENQLLRVLTLYSSLGIPALLLVGPLFSPTASAAGMAVFWIVLAGLLTTLFIALWRFRGKRIL